MACSSTTRGLSRRGWLTRCIGLAAGTVAAARLGAAPTSQAGPTARAVQTVTGAVDASALGLTLMHEHLLVDFVGAADVHPSRYDANDVFRRVLPHLAALKARGAATLVECTPAYLGRDPRLLRRLSDASGVRILTNTGYYGANQDRHLPPLAFTETAEALANRWIREWKDGIDGTGIRPAFMKIGVDAGPLSAVDAKLVHAAAMTHQATGLPIASHTGNGVAALQELDLLDAAGVRLSAFIWVHAQGEPDAAVHVAAAARGAWVSFDGVSETSAERHVTLVRQMMAAGHLDRVLVSHDAGWYRVGEPDGGQFRPFDAVFTRFIPAFTAAGATDADVRQLLVVNPRRVLEGDART
jgi:phosphotriesterase-related protein